MTVDLVSVFVTAGVTIIGWFVANQFGMAQNRINKRRELKVQYLVEAYRNLEAVSNRLSLSNEEQKVVERAVADLQLFGTKAEVEAAQEFIATQAKEGIASIANLLQLMRKNLREELNLEAVPHNLLFLRYIPNSDKSFNLLGRHPISENAAVQSVQVHQK